MRIEPRADLALLPGYHSPQVAVAVRLNTNESPESPPQQWERELADMALPAIEWNRYPDREARSLRAAIGALHSVGPEQVFCANGSNEVLQTLLLTYGGPGRRAAVWEPTYALHSHIARITGTGVLEGERRDDFSLDVDAVRERITTERPAVAFLCSPNNPTGVVDPPEAVAAVLEAAEAVGCLVVVDEAYGQFSASSALSLVAEDRPLVVTRTFSKTWSMAAARLGYLIGPTWAVDDLHRVVLPYHLDAFKQRAGELALAQRDAMDARVERLVAERERLVAGLGALRVNQWPSGANFVLLRPLRLDGTPGDRDYGDQVWQALLDQEVLVRNCSSWPRLDGCLRVTIGTPAEDDAFLAALEEALR